MMDRGIKDCIAILAGDPQGREDYVADLDRQIATLELQLHVKRVGHCTDMPAALALANIVTVASTEPEAFGRSAVEAEAMQTPVIVSDLGAVPETVLSPPDCPAETRTGWRIPPNDPQALADAMMEALALSPLEREELGRRARTHVVENFSLERMTDDTLAIYQEFLTKSAEKPH
jgi:glycosyltransferase involved in cell wall biosynthesis